MTKVTILGEEPKESKKLKPIEFIKYIECGKGEENHDFETCGDNPNQWEKIVLISKKYRGGILDLMLCYDFNPHCDSNSTSSILVLGHFNDGLVE